MKNILKWFVLAILLSTISLPVLAQVPQGISFQAVARDGSGIPYALTPVTIGIRIKDSGGTIVYAENHSVTTDQFGLFKLVIGNGTVVSGTFPGINWSSNQHQVQVLVNGSPLSDVDFQTVPYAFTADEVDMGLDGLNDVNTTGLSVGQSLSWDGTQWVPATFSGEVWKTNGSSAYYDMGRVGIGTNTPKAALHLSDTSNVIFGDDYTGSGFKLLYYAQKGAMRVGYLNNPFGGYNYDKFWDYDSVGYYSFAGGRNSRAKGFGAFAFGSFGWADGSGSVAFFGSARGNNSYTFGGSSKGRGSFTVEGTAEEEGGIAMYGYTGGRYGVSIGGGTTGLGASSSREDYAVAIGWNSDARGQASIALGPSDAYGYNSFSTGWVTEARGNYSSTFGYRTNSYPYASMAIGRYNIINGDSASWNNGDPIFIIGDGTSNTNRSNSFMIQKNGQTSIGYNSPTGMLNVSTTLGSLNNSGLDVGNAALLLGTATNGLAFDANQIEVLGTGLHINFNSTEDLFLVNGGGDVAIGHSAPAAKLDVEGTGWQFQLDNPGAGGGDWYIGSSQNTWASGGGKFLISPSGSSANAALAIVASSQVGIGTTTPSDRLQVDAVAGEDALRVRVNGTTALRVHDNLGVSVGVNATPPTNGLLVAGPTIPNSDNLFDLGTPTRRWDDVWATNGVIQTSDARLKTNVQNLNYGLAAIAQLRPVTFNWIDKPEEEKKLGLIAQEVNRILPEVVRVDSDPEVPMGVNYAELVPVLIKGMQEQQSLIERQEKELQEVKKELEEIRRLLKKSKK